MGALPRLDAVLATIQTAAVLGIDACQVQVEVDVSFGLPDASVRESRDRVRAAIRNSGFEFPPHRITVNLAPGDLRKVGASFDLPIALGILAASGHAERRQIDDLLVVGGLSLDGAIQPTRGVLPIAVAARRASIAGLLLPRVNAAEAAVVTGLHLHPVGTLSEAVAVVNDPRPEVVPPATRPADGGTEDLAEVVGQTLARRALEIAAAGGHNLLMVGPPGTGKTMLARRLPGILPELTFEESLAVTAIHSVAGLVPPGGGLVTRRPFRAPHHTISDVALVGGGVVPRPGEISLAHHGVLFLDEIPEFSRHVIEVLRQPLEEGCARIARAAQTVVFPARFVLVAAMNPCPCGYLGHPIRPCRCTPLQVERYRSRLSGPMRDRLDLTVEVGALEYSAFVAVAPVEPSAAVRARVLAARHRQLERSPASGEASNARLPSRAVRRLCRPDSAGARLLGTAAHRLGLSARGITRVLKVARTVADLAGATEVGGDHLAEALQFRASD